MNARTRKELLLRINLVVAAVSGILTLWQMAREPSEQGAALLWGFSIPRLLIFAVIILFILLSAICFSLSLRQGFWETRTGNLMNLLFDRNEVTLAILVLLALSYLALFSSNTVLGHLASFRDRLFPLVWWMTILFLQLLLTQMLLRLPGVPVWQNYRGVFQATLVALAAFGMLVLFIAITRLGLEPDRVLWQEAGTPLLFPQVVLAWGVGFGLFLVFQSGAKAGRSGWLKFLDSGYFELLVCIALWALAYTLWISYPLRPSYNTSEPVPPNFQSYPLGDAMIYDANARSVFIGNPIPNDFTQKPFYAFFLVILHGIAGQDYGRVIQLQVAIFACIPILIYLLVKGMSTRTAGWIAALLVIFRERNSISLSNVIQVTHSRLLMSDVLSMGLMTLLMTLALAWLRRPHDRRTFPLIMGGILGVFALTRLNSILLFPFLALALALILVPARQYRRLLEGTVLIAIGLSIPFGVWMWRNYQWTGRLTIQEPVAHYTEFIAKLYSMDPQTAPPLLPGEDYDAYYHRIQGQPLSFLREHPGEVARFVSAHTMHNVIYSLVYLPESLVNERTTSYVRRLPFWGSWGGSFTAEMRGMLVFNLLILSLGSGLLWKKSRTLVFVPLIVAGGYILSVSLGRVSGWRFILPVDWITLAFYATGLVQVSHILYAVFTGKFVPVHPVTFLYAGDGRLMPRNWIGFGVTGLVLLGLGLGLTKGHTLFPKRYAAESPQEILTLYSERLPGERLPLDPALLRDFLAGDEALALHGRALYPSYLASDEGELNWWYLAFAPRLYDRLAFQVIGPDKLGVIGPDEVGVVLPMDNAPDSFPDGADVIVFGCLVDNEYDEKLPGYIDALLVVVNTSPPRVYLRDPLPELACPFPVP